MPLEHQRLATTGAGAFADDARTILEGGLLADVDDVGRDLLGGRLPLVDLEAEPLHRVADDGLDRSLVEGDGFGTDEIEMKPNDVVAAGVDGGADVGGRWVCGHRAFFLSCRAYGRRGAPHTRCGGTGIDLRAIGERLATASRPHGLGREPLAIRPLRSQILQDLRV